MIVADASVLIALAKIGMITLLKQLFGEVLIGPTVKAEALDRGREISAPEVGHIQQAIDERWLRTARLGADERRLAQRLVRGMGLDIGEAEAISLAKSRNLALIVDDKDARTVAETLRFEYLGTAAVLLQAHLADIITLEELEEALRRLARIMWLSPDVVAELLRRARGVRK